MRRRGGGLDFSIHQYKNTVKNRVTYLLSQRSTLFLYYVKIRLHSSITNPLSLMKKGVENYLPKNTSINF